MFIAGAALGMIGGVVGAFGAKKEAYAQAAAENLNATIVHKNMIIEKKLAKRAGYKGIGATTADYGASGVTLGGSASDVLRESARDIAFQVKSIKEVGLLEYQQHIEAAKAYKRGGNMALASGLFKAAGSALMGGMGG